MQIDYTGLSFVVPRKMHFRYRLLGHDTEWQDVGTRRQAFYTDLPPREIVQRGLTIASDICVYTNSNITVLEPTA